MSVTVYTLFNEADDPLYVGISASPGRRFGQHGRQPWWPAVSTARLEHFATRDEARAHERRLIAALAPPHNLTDTQAVSGATLRAARRRAGLSVETVAVAAKVSVGTVERVELGRVTPRRATLKGITDAVGIDLDATGAAA